ncbi:DNA polymerase III subunit [Aquifex sp.]
MHRTFLEKLLKLGRVPSGLLFYGPSGSGKTKTALEFAKALLCTNEEAWGCGKCSSCRYINDFENNFWKGEIDNFKVYEESEGRKAFLYLRGEHPDFIFVPPHGNYIKIDQIRGIKEFVQVRPALSKRKVIIIDDAHTMTNQAANALLKVLEEPPEDTTFILTTDKKSAILPTILSRTFTVEFKGFTPEEIKKITGVDDTVAKLSGGSLTKALLLKENRNLINKAKEFLKDDPLAVYKISEEFEKWDTPVKTLFLELLESFLMEQVISEKKEELIPVMDRVRMLKEGLPRGLNGSLWLLEISAEIGGLV